MNVDRDTATASERRVLSMSVDADEGRMARRALRTFLGECGVPDDRVDDAALVMAELVENGCAACAGAAPVQIVLAASPGLVVVAVTNERLPGEREVVLPAVRMPSPAQPRGRGLPLVALLSARLGVDQSERTTTVRAELAW